MYDMSFDPTVPQSFAVPTSLPVGDSGVLPTPPVVAAVSLLEQGVVKPVHPTPEAPLPTPPFTALNPSTGMQSVAPKTTAEEDITTAGQRKVNLIWEYTQASVALLTVLGNLIVAVYFAVNRIPSNEYPIVLSSVLFLVVGAYFQRTNHQLTGGTGVKPENTQPYVGRG